MMQPAPYDIAACAAWAREELRIRKDEQAAVATYADFCTMKRRWADRRKAVGLTRAQAKLCLAEAEREVGAPERGNRETIEAAA